MPPLRTTHTHTRSQLEGCPEAFRRVVAFGCNAEARLVRCAAVRLMGRAVGLGGGMGVFLAQPLMEGLTVRGARALLYGASPLHH